MPGTMPGMLRILRWIAVVGVAVDLAALAAHVLELPNKLALPADVWLAVQQRLYRGWGPVLGPFEAAAVLATSTAALLVRGRPGGGRVLGAAACLALSLALFFLLVEPVNVAVAEWTPATLPPDWPDFRRRWELGHAVRAALAATAFGLLTLRAGPCRAVRDARPAAAHAAPRRVSGPVARAPSWGCPPGGIGYMCRMSSRLGAAVAAAVLAAIRVAPAADVPALRFLKDGAEVGRVDLATLRAKAGETTVTVDDPYYGRRMTFRAVPLAAVLAVGFGEPASAFAAEDVVLRAADGYAKPTTGARLAAAGGFLAFGDASRPADAPAFLPMGRRALDPAPFYLVWTGAAGRDPNAPWPYQLVAVERQDFARAHPHTVPRGAPEGSPAWIGFRVFKTDCVACHAVNGEGGTVGPDLNVPQSIVEYRPVEQIKAYVRDPAAFRYGNMPAHPHLGAAELDGLIAYFETMRRAKHDPRAAGGGG